MPITHIIHGEHRAASRSFLQSVIGEYKARGLTPQYLAAKSLTRAQLEHALGSANLFGAEEVLIIEELHSLPTSTRKKELLELLSSEFQHPVIIWEKRSLTKTMLKKVSAAKAIIKEFAIPKTFFAWLDSLSGHQASRKKSWQLFQQTLEHEDAWFCFSMLSSRIRQLISISYGGEPSKSPYMLKKLATQARSFTPDQLFDWHTKLYYLDKNHKTGLNNLDLVTELDLLHLGEYYQ